MTPPLVARFPLVAWGWLGVVILGLAAFCDRAAADADMSFTVVSPAAADHPAPEITPVGTVVLRGNSAVANAEPPGAGTVANLSPAAPLPSLGWDRGYDIGGFDRTHFDTAGIDTSMDRNYDATGFDRRFDRGGLSHP